MFAMNVGNAPLTLKQYESLKSITLRVNGGIKLEGGKLELDYYRRYKNAGIRIVPDEEYFRANGKSIEVEVPVVVPVQVDDKAGLSEDGKKEDNNGTDVNTELPGANNGTDVNTELPGASNGTDVNTDTDKFDKDEENSNGEKKELPLNPDDLRGDAIYSYEFLTMNKCAEILKARGIEFDKDLRADALKSLVLESNPIA